MQSFRSAQRTDVYNFYEFLAEFIDVDTISIISGQKRLERYFRIGLPSVVVESMEQVAEEVFGQGGKNDWKMRCMW